MREIGNHAFGYCYCLRNVAFPSNAVFGDDIFFDEEEDEDEVDTDLYQLFGSESGVRRALMHRFNELTIHSIVYYQSYNENELQILIAARNMRSGQSQTYAVSWI